MAVLGPADVAFLDGAGPIRIDQDGLVVDAKVEQRPANAFAVGIGADDAGQSDPGAERAQHRGDAAGPAQSLLALVGVQQNHRRFLADALGVAPDVAVEHQVADHQHARLAQVLHQFDQVARHGDLPTFSGGSESRAFSAALRAAAKRSATRHAACSSDMGAEPRAVNLHATAACSSGSRIS